MTAQRPHPAAPVTTISAAGLASLQGFEGFRERAYKDIVGVWTVGFGETSLNGRPVREGDRLPLPAALERLRARCDGEFGPAVRRAIGPVAAAALTQPQYDALVSLAYNIGKAGFAGSTVARQLRAGAPEAAADAMLMWRKAGGQVQPVLVRRRMAERRLFLTGEYPR